MSQKTSIDSFATEAFRGLELTIFNINRTGFGFELRGSVNGKELWYSVSTGYELSVSPSRDALSAADFSSKTWPFLEQKVSDVTLGEDELAYWATFRMEGGAELVGWQLREDALDNIFIVRSLADEGWFTIG